VTLIIVFILYKPYIKAIHDFIVLNSSYLPYIIGVLFTSRDNWFWVLTPCNIM